MRLNLLYFAALRELLGKAEEQLALETPVGTVAELQGLLLQQYPVLEKCLPSVRFAVNESFAEAGTRLAEGDRVALIPPVSGG